MSARRRVLVTGLGLVSPLGRNVELSWQKLINGESGILPEFGGAEKLPIARVIDVSKEDLKAVTLNNPRAQEPRFISLSLLATKEALKDSGLGDCDFDACERNVAVVIGNGMGAATSEIPIVAQFIANSMTRKVSPYFVPRLLPNMAAGNVSIVYKFNGPVLSPATACASGGHAINDATRLIERGDVDIAVCGGTESVLDDVSAIGFSRLKALSSNCSQNASRPFDVNRDGFVMGEGAGIIILEAEEHFLKRQSDRKVCYARIAGTGMSGDGYHVTSPSPSGVGAELCMKRAVKDSGFSFESIDYINAHATSTPVGDIIEAKAIARLFQERVNKKLKVSSTKGATGHLLGAAGAVEAIFSILSCHHQIVPPTINLENLDPELPLTLDFIVNKAEKDSNLRVTMSNSFGFGGTNVSLIFEKY